MSKRTEKQQRALVKQALYGQDAAPAPPATEQARPAQHRGRTLLTAVLVVVLGVLVLLLAVNTLPGLLPGVWEDTMPNLAQNPVLPKGQDAGQAYIDETLFLGDSNTVRLASYGLVPQERVLAISGLGIAEVDSLAAISMQGEARSLTMVQAVGKLQPKRLLITMGTNDIGNLSPERFAETYRRVLEGLRAASPQTHIVVNAIPPVNSWTAYGRIDAEEIGRYNDALVQLCREMELPFLHSFEGLSGADGYCPEGFTEPDGLHLTDAALAAMLDYYRTHPWQP